MNPELESSNGVAPAELAAATAAKAFDECDINGDGQLSFEVHASFGR
jgi:hypothetical protein